jgi:hypothetical protein
MHSTSDANKTQHRMHMRSLGIRTTGKQHQHGATTAEGVAGCSCWQRPHQGYVGQPVSHSREMTWTESDTCNLKTPAPMSRSAAIIAFALAPRRRLDEASITLVRGARSQRQTRLHAQFEETFETHRGCAQPQGRDRIAERVSASARLGCSPTSVRDRPAPASPFGEQNANWAGAPRPFEPTQRQRPLRSPSLTFLRQTVAGRKVEPRD